MTEFKEGYKTALESVDKAITQSLQQNNNGTKSSDFLNVFNDTTGFIQSELARL